MWWQIFIYMLIEVLTANSTAARMTEWKILSSLEGQKRIKSIERRRKFIAERQQKEEQNVG